MIRAAENKDIPDIVRMSKEFWQNTQFKDEPFKTEMVEGMARKCIDDGISFVFESGGIARGFLNCVKGVLLANDDIQVASEIAWWVDEEFRSSGAGIRLLSAVEKEAKAQGIKYLSMIYMKSSMPDMVESLYQRSGYNESEVMHVKVL